MSTHEIFYTGDLGEGVIVREGEERRLLKPRVDLNDGSSAVLQWGSKNSDGSRLSLALLADVLGDDQRALRLQHSFNRRVVTILPDRWTISRSRILAHVKALEAAERMESANRLTPPTST